MSTLTVKNLPAQIHSKLKQRAHRHHRSLNGEIIACLEATLGSTAIEVDAFLARAQQLRYQVGGSLTDKKLLQLKEQGRP